MVGKKGYEPVDKQSAAAVMKKRVLVITLVIMAVFIVLVGIHLKGERTEAINKNDRFSALLMDERAFYFPSLVSAPSEGRRALDDMSDDANDDDDSESTYIPWRREWKQDIATSAAIGEYYSAKGMALLDYYSNATSSPDMWTSDWQADTKHGMEIGDLYKSIGEAITAHFRQVYDPNHRKGLKGRITYDWQSDRDRGAAIGKLYFDIALKISKHYNKTKWSEYAESGNQIARYYHKRGRAIKYFYKGRFADMWTQVQKSRQTLVDPIILRNEMKAKGLAINEYYRARYDPTYQSAPCYDPTESFDATREQFPPWGEDTSADKAHGKAIGSYFNKHGNEVGQCYKQRGKDLGKFYQNYYRTLFEQTYSDPTDL